MSKELHSLYLHFPYCKSHCNYCDFYSELLHSPSKIVSFEKTLHHAWNKHQVLLEKEGFKFGPLQTLYFGGGTPSLWGKQGAEFWQKFWKENSFSFAQNYEWTMELNPAAYELEGLGAWEDLGLNRYSVGIQTLNETLLKSLGRRHNLTDSRQALKLLQGKNYSADLMLGLPFSEGKRSVLEELKELLSYEPKHLSVYILTVEEDYPFFKELPCEEWIEKEFLEVSEFLCSLGYLHYEVSNFAKANFEARHNLRYWESSSVAALGPSATGLLVKGNKALRYKWNEAGEDFECESLDEKSFKLERLYMRLRTHLGLNPQDFFTSEETEVFLKIAFEWKDRGLLTESQKGFYLTAQGYLLLDSLMDEIFISIKSF